MAQQTQQRITRDDLEAKFREAQASVQGKLDDKKSAVVSAGVVVALVLLVLFFLLGRRAGKKKTTFVDIRRV